MRRIRVKYRPIVNTKNIEKNIRSSMARGLPNALDLSYPSQKLVLAGGGPSLTHQVQKIRSLIANGARLIAVNEAGNFLIKKGIKPWGIAHISPAPTAEKCIGETHKDIIYFIASIAPPSVFELLQENTVRLWHTDCPGIETVLNTQNVKIINGGQTVGLRVLQLGFYLGFRHFHIFGLDSSLDSGELHAYKSYSFFDEPNGIRLVCGSESFHCTYEMAGQAQDAPNLLQDLKNRGCNISLYGNGLLPHIWKIIETGGPPPILMLKSNKKKDLWITADMF